MKTWGLVSQSQRYREYSTNGWTVRITNSNNTLGGHADKETVVKLCQPPFSRGVARHPTRRDKRPKGKGKET